MLIRHHDFSETIPVRSDMPRLSKNTLQNSLERKTSGLFFTCSYFDSLCRCSVHAFFHILFTSRGFFSSYEVHFWGLACQGSCWCSCLAAPHHANSFIHKKWSNLHKKRRSAVHWDYNVAVSCWTLGIAETFRGKHHHDTAATDQCYWRCRSYCKRNEHRTRLFEHLWTKFQKNPCQSISSSNISFFSNMSYWF